MKKNRFPKTSLALSLSPHWTLDVRRWALSVKLFIIRLPSEPALLATPTCHAIASASAEALARSRMAPSHVGVVADQVAIG